jgi:hypothetical protein
MHQADLVVQHLRNGREAVGGARSVGDDGVAGLQHVVVHAVDHGCVHVLLARRRNHDFLRATGQVQAGLGFAGEQAGAFEHEVHAELAPRQLGRIAFGKYADAVAVHDQGIALDLHLAAKLAVHGVVAREVGVRLRVAQVIQRDDLNVFAARFVQGAQHVAADAAVAVDSDFDGHVLPSAKR